MKIDLTITISVVLALAAIISPIIVSIINNKYQLKLKEIENNDIAKRNAFEKYSKSVGNYIVFGSRENELEMINSLYGLLPYFRINISDIILVVESSEDKEIIIQRSNELLEILKMQL